MKVKILTALAATTIVAGPTLLLRGQDDASSQGPVRTIGNVSKVNKAYDEWKADYIKGGWGNKLVTRIGYDTALSQSKTDAYGQMVLDLSNGKVEVEVNGLATDADYDVWFVDNIPGEGRSIKPEPGDKMVRVGQMAQNGDQFALDTQLDSSELTDFDIDRIVVAKAGDSVEEAGILFGSPSFFQRLYFSEKSREVAMFRKDDGVEVAAAEAPGPFNFLVPGVAHAHHHGELAAILGEQVALGEDLFFNETFGGNGRTCGTCHPAENNMTIDPLWISGLPANDPLFVAEFDPALAELENPTLMRELGLILVNKDGFDRPGVFRSPMVILALTQTRKGEQSTGFPFEQGLGWAGDGGGPNNELRQFPPGGIKQHFPKTMNRVDGVDFRLPTEEELDAMEAFMKSTGRQEEYNLDAITFKSSFVEIGKQLFVDREGPAKCGRCHGNAGSNSSTTGENGQRNTGTEDPPEQPAWTLAEQEGFDMLCDGGFGKGNGQFTRVDGKQGPLNDACDKTCLGGTRTGGCGDGTFNTVSVIEAADTPPFFHNSIAETVEESVEFYNTPAFFNSPSVSGQGGIGPVDMNNTQILQIAAFLRAINAVENGRSGTDFANKALGASLQVGRKFARLALEEAIDAVDVLTGGPKFLYPKATDLFFFAQFQLEDALFTTDLKFRDACILEAIKLMDSARQNMISEI